MTGYDIDGIEPGSGADGGGGSIPYDGYAIAAVGDDTLYSVDHVFGWSLQNLSAGLSTLYIRLGNDGTATPYIAINLAENETVTQMLPGGITSPDGFFITVESGSVDGILYTD